MKEGAIFLPRGAAMHYVLDGYNLLFALGWLLHGDRPSRRRWARDKLLRHLQNAPGLEPASVTVVFDASAAPPGVPREEQLKGIRVLFAVEQNADDLIEDLIHREPRPQQLTVVSNDHRLHQAARHRHCPFLTCLDFIEQIGRSPPATTGPVEMEGPGKPETLDREEVQSWLRAFGVINEE